MAAKDIVRESTLETALGVDDTKLAALRSAGMPYIDLGDGYYLYNIESVATWLTDQEYEVGYTAADRTRDDQVATETAAIDSRLPADPADQSDLEIIAGLVGINSVVRDIVPDQFGNDAVAYVDVYATKEDADDAYEGVGSPSPVATVEMKALWSDLGRMTKGKRTRTV